MKIPSQAKSTINNNPINKFKKYCKSIESKTNEICWFCLKKCEYKCDKTLKPIIFKNKNVKTNEEFDKMCEDFTYLKVENDDVLKVEICFYNLCIYTNNIIYKSNKNDIALEDIVAAIDLSTRSKKFSKKYTTLHIKSSFNFEPDESELDKYFNYLGENILEHVNERLFKDIFNVVLILE